MNPAYTSRWTRAANAPNAYAASLGPFGVGYNGTHKLRHCGAARSPPSNSRWAGYKTTGGGLARWNTTGDAVQAVSGRTVDINTCFTCGIALGSRPA